MGKSPINGPFSIAFCMFTRGQLGPFTAERCDHCHPQTRAETSEAQDHLHGNDEQRQSVPNLTVRRKVPQGARRIFVGAPIFLDSEGWSANGGKTQWITIIYYGLWMFMVDISNIIFWLVVT